MERTCGFCVARKPTVLCGADKAFLCLSCDAKVHSANALSGRHFRSLLCESCGDKPAHFHCLDHRMLLCHPCNRTLHRNNSKHQKRMVSSFTGSPSAKQFAILWGFEVDWSNIEDPLAGPSTSSISAGSVINRHEPTKQSGLIMQQILDLSRLQISGVNNQSSAIRERGKSHSSASCIYNNLETVDVCPEDSSRDPGGPIDDFSGSSQSEYLSSYASSDPFWQSGNALESKQYWAGDERVLSEEFNCFEDLKMPEVDMTFPNFEELLREDMDLSRSLLEDSCSAHESENNSAQFKGGSVSSSELMDGGAKLAHSYSNSFPHLSAESGDCRDAGHSTKGQESNLVGRSKHMKKPRLQAKKTRLAPRGGNVNPGKRPKGRVLKLEDERCLSI